jgi:hypothetical protein
MFMFILGLVLFSWQINACVDGKGFLPDDVPVIPPHIKSGLTQEQYNEAIDKVTKVYSPVVRSWGAQLSIHRLWDSATVNAGTLRAGRQWIVNLYGGFARHPFITQDGYMLVICHEIGHHIGGAPKKAYQSGMHWASTEGQSDYFATLKCLRKVFRNDNNLEIVKGLEVPSAVRTECETSFRTDWEQALCIRTSLAGLSVAKVNADGRRVPLPDLETMDDTVVSSTNNGHPIPQCRLNTYYQGSICTVSSTRRLSQVWDKIGTCHVKNGHTRGLRPNCWYKSPK